jgi:hypothetical protein
VLDGLRFFNVLDVIRSAYVVLFVLHVVGDKAEALLVLFIGPDAVSEVGLHLLTYFACSLCHVLVKNLFVTISFGKTEHSRLRNMNSH